MPATKPRSRRLTPRTAPQLVGSEEILDRVEETLGALARRAYEIFESKGRHPGRDLEDWLRAETELLHSTRVEIFATARGLRLRAEVAGFQPSELRVCVEPRRVTIVGERRPVETRGAGKAIYAERRAERVLRFVDLPVPVDAAGATAVLKGGVCELTLPRAAPAA